MALLLIDACYLATRAPLAVQDVDYMRMRSKMEALLHCELQEVVFIAPRRLEVALPAARRADGRRSRHDSWRRFLASLQVAKPDGPAFRVVICDDTKACGTVLACETVRALMAKTSAKSRKAGRARQQRSAAATRQVALLSAGGDSSSLVALLSSFAAGTLAGHDDDSGDDEDDASRPTVTLAGFDGDCRRLLSGRSEQGVISLDLTADWRSLRHKKHSEREQRLQAFKEMMWAGVRVQKHGRRGSAKPRVLRMDEACMVLTWDSKKRKKEWFELADIIAVIDGFDRFARPKTALDASCCLSLVIPSRTLDLECTPSLRQQLLTGFRLLLFGEGEGEGEGDEHDVSDDDDDDDDDDGGGDGDGDVLGDDEHAEGEGRRGGGGGHEERGDRHHASHPEASAPEAADETADGDAGGGRRHPSPPSPSSPSAPMRRPRAWDDEGDDDDRPLARRRSGRSDSRGREGGKHGDGDEDDLGDDIPMLRDDGSHYAAGRSAARQAASKPSPVSASKLDEEDDDDEDGDEAAAASVVASVAASTSPAVGAAASATAAVAGSGSSTSSSKLCEDDEEDDEESGKVAEASRRPAGVEESKGSSGSAAGSVTGSSAFGTDSGGHRPEGFEPLRGKIIYKTAQRGETYMIVSLLENLALLRGDEVADGFTIKCYQPEDSKRGQVSFDLPALMSACSGEPSIQRQLGRLLLPVDGFFPRMCNMLGKKEIAVIGKHLFTKLVIETREEDILVYLNP